MKAEEETEREGRRLLRCLDGLKAEKADNVDLCLTQQELQTASETLNELLSGAGTKSDLIGLSIGTKQAQNDWGDANSYARRVAARDRHDD